jgi:type II secretory pathway component GspD/PulD (secretin)
MPLNCKRVSWAATGAGVTFAFIAAGFIFAASAANAQTKPDETKQEGTGYIQVRPNPQEPAPVSVETIFLTNVAQQNDLNDIQTDLRNVLPESKIYGIQSQNAITFEGRPEALEIAKKLVADLDRPRPQYRLTYTITDLDSGKRTGSQNYVVLAVLGQRSILKQGNRVPIVTGTSDNPPQNSQVQYQDVGLAIEATVDGSPDGLTLHTKIEQSSLAADKSATAPQDPVLHQTVVQETAELSAGKPLVLGSLDIPGTAQSQQIALTAELVH